MSDKNQSLSQIEQSDRVINVIFWCIIIGAAGSIPYSFQAASFAQFFSITGVVLAVAGASLLVGSLLGFLFGIPKTLQKETVDNLSTRTRITKQDVIEESEKFQPNTSLEQISDWLTKILVGAGLTQLMALPKFLQDYGSFVAPGIGNFENSDVFAIAQLIYFLTCGFILSYLWTRLHLEGAMYQIHKILNADLTEYKKYMDAIQQKEQQQKQQEENASALNIALSQIDSNTISRPIPQAQLNEIIKQATPAARKQIYEKVTQVLNQERDNSITIEEASKIIPILRALIASEKECPDYHGDLGEMLSNQRHPNWSEAITELTTAIKMRGSVEEQGCENWEFWRAYCNISQNTDFKNNKKSDSRSKAEILADLRVVGRSAWIAEFIWSNPTISRWVKLNKVSEFNPKKVAKKPSRMAS